MAGVREHTELDAWKLSDDLATRIREVIDRPAFGRHPALREQIEDAAESPPANIAEGFDRGSNKEFIQFLVIARGTVSEVRSLAYAGTDIGHLDSAAFYSLSGRCTRRISLINGFIRFLKNTDRKC